MSGHGHQDCGRFEFHWRDIPIVVGPGRGHYGNHLASLENISGLGHSGVTIDGEDPFLPNKLCYDDEFRRRSAYEPPMFNRSKNSVSLTYDTRKYGLKREWAFEVNTVVIKDVIKGQGRRRVQRNLQMTGSVEAKPGGSVLKQGESGFHVAGEDGETLSFHPRTCWNAYGKGRRPRQRGLPSTSTCPGRESIRLRVQES